MRFNPFRFIQNWIKEYKRCVFEWIYEPKLTKKQISYIRKCTAGKWAFDRKTGLVDIDGNFFAFGLDSRKQLECSFNGIRFGKVTGSFYCNKMNLTLLYGAPQEVGGDFYCNDNELTTLMFSPRKVGNNFLAQYNKIEFFDSSIDEIGGDFLCHTNELLSLENGPKFVKGKYWAFSNKLTNLIGASEGPYSLWIHDNKITSLEGLPKNLNDLTLYGNPFRNDLGKKIARIYKGVKTYEEACLMLLNEMLPEERKDIFCETDPIKILTASLEEGLFVNYDLLIEGFGSIIKVELIEAGFNMGKAQKISRVSRLLDRA